MAVSPIYNTSNICHPCNQNSSLQSAGNLIPPDSGVSKPSSSSPPPSQQQVPLKKYKNKPTDEQTEKQLCPGSLHPSPGGKASPQTHGKRGGNVLNPPQLGTDTEEEEFRKARVNWDHWSPVSAVPSSRFVRCSIKPEQSHHHPSSSAGRDSLASSFIWGHPHQTSTASHGANVTLPSSVCAFEPAGLGNGRAGKSPKPPGKTHQSSCSTWKSLGVLLECPIRL